MLVVNVGVSKDSYSSFITSSSFVWQSDVYDSLLILSQRNVMAQLSNI